MSFYTIGIDEAGRGPMIGPMVIGAVVCDENSADAFCDMKLQDSKAFGSGEAAVRKRKKLAGIIKETAFKWHLEIVSTEVIDEHVRENRLNKLEIGLVLRMLKGFGVRFNKIFLDGQNLFGPVLNVYPQAIAENKGDKKYLEIMAASIIAKDKRDELIRDIYGKYEPEFGKIPGNGYCNKGTAEFLKKYEARYSSLPPEARKSWNWNYR